MRTALYFAALLGCGSFLAPIARAAHPLDFVPADSAFVYARSQPFSGEQLKVVAVPSASLSMLHTGYQLGELIYLLDEWDEPVVSTEAQTDSAGDVAVTDTEPAASEWRESPARRMLLALRDELDQLKQPSDERRLGLKANGTFAFYSVDLIPVIRFEAGALADFTALLERLQVAYGRPFEQWGTAREPLWAIPAAQLRVLVGRLNNHVVITVAPADASPAIRRLLLDKPRHALGVAGLRRFNRSMGFLPVGSGYIDSLRVATLLTGEPTELHRAYADSIGVSPRSAADCVDQWQAVAAVAPRMTIGSTRVDRRAWDVRTVLQLRPDLASELQALSARAPTLDHSDISMALGMAMDPAQLIAFARKRAQAVAADPWTCSDLLELNTAFADLDTQIKDVDSTMMLGVKGVALGVGAIGFAKDSAIPTDAEFTLAIHSTEIDLLLGWLQVMLPQLAQSGLTADGKPVRVQLEGLSPMFSQAYAVQGERLLAVSNAVNSPQWLGEIHAQSLDGSGPVMNLRFDARGIQLLLQLMDMDPSLVTQSAQRRARDQAYNQLIVAGLQSIDLRMNFTGTGIEFYQTAKLQTP